MADVAAIRKQVLEAYPMSSSWPSKVAKMSDSQVFAVFARLSRENRIRKPLNS